MGGSGYEKGLRRFYTPLIDTVRGVATIEGEELRHLKKVLRLKEGDPLVVLDGRGRAFRGRVERLSHSSALIRLGEELEPSTESPIKITLLQALLKGDKNTLLVQKATELGVSRIVLFTTRRTVREPSVERIGRLKERLERVSIESLKQCGRTLAPEILITEFEDALTAGTTSPLKLIFHERAKTPLKEALGQPAGAVTVAVGPEGGFSAEEVALAESKGYRAVGCGPRVLRAETMGMVAVALVQYALGDMG